MEKFKERKVGTIIQYFASDQIAQVKLIEILRTNDLIHIVGLHTNFKQLVEFMYIGRKAVKEAKAGEVIWLGVNKRVHKGNEVFLILEETKVSEESLSQGGEGEIPPKPTPTELTPRIEEEEKEEKPVPINEDEKPDFPEDWDNFGKNKKKKNITKGRGTSG